MSTEFDLMNDDDDVTKAERRPLCVSISSTGTRLGVGGASGFRIFALKQASVADASTRDDIGRVQLQEVVRFPPPPQHDSDDEYFGEVVAESPMKANRRQDASPAHCGVGSLALVGETQTVAVVGGGSTPMAPLNIIVIFYGVHRTHEIVLQDAVRRLAMTKWFIVALTHTSIEVVSLQGVRLYSTPALGNALHLAPGSLCLHTTKRLFAFPVTEAPPSPRVSGLAPTTNAAPTYGVKIVSYPTEDFMNAFTPTAQQFDLTTYIPEAHKNPLSSICLNHDASLVATSSERGTLIRVWNVADGSMLKELRSASIASPLSQLCFIDKLHIAGQSGHRIKVFYVGTEDAAVDATKQKVEFWKEDKDRDALAKNQSSRLAPFGYVCSYLNSKWAVAEVELPLAKFTPVSMTIQSTPPTSKTLSTDSFASVSREVINDTVVATASSWMGYLGSWIGTSSPPAAPPQPISTPTAVHHRDLSSTARPELVDYVPTSLEELCVVWWEQRISRFIIDDNSAGAGDLTGRGRSYSKGPADARAQGGGSAEKLCYFYCANSDGKLIRLEFDAQAGTIRVIGPSSPVVL